MDQRTTYKIIDRILSLSYESQLELLSALVRDIVDNDRFVMTGGRVWEYDEKEAAYILRYQYGETELLTVGTRRSLVPDSPFSNLTKHQTIVSVDEGANDDLGRREYTLSGVGDVLKRPDGNVFKYALAFTAHSIAEEFRDTLVVVGAAATTALRNMQSTVRENRMRKDLDQAWQIQSGLVPEHARRFLEYDLYGVSLPESIVGGDYFDYLTTSEKERLGVVISDAASKGLPAAVQALFVSGAMRMGVGFETKMSSLISRLNTLIYDTFPHERFVSLCYCELTHSSNGLVLYANAGHCPPLHYKANTGAIDRLQPTGGILGIVADQQFRVENINMGHGDVLVLFTDGITEAQDRTGTLYSEERLEDVVRMNASRSSESITQAILDDVHVYSAGARYADDKTLVVIKRD
ncbi:MAG: PP2C family protein-serine/threonine phosphatase [Candidatus Kapabacteria bacterium]|nr:PP2C family protein-serine/threonine phosphatase [Candidatus Kapabacteria bacterium]